MAQCQLPLAGRLLNVFEDASWWQTKLILRQRRLSLGLLRSTGISRRNASGSHFYQITVSTAEHMWAEFPWTLRFIVNIASMLRTIPLKPPHQQVPVISGALRRVTPLGTSVLFAI